MGSAVWVVLRFSLFWLDLFVIVVCCFGLWVFCCLYVMSVFGFVDSIMCGANVWLFCGLVGVLGWVFW